MRYDGVLGGHVDEFANRQVVQLLQLLQWEVSEEEGTGLINAWAKYGAERRVYCPSILRHNPVKAVRKMTPDIPDWVVFPHEYRVDERAYDSLIDLGVKRVMRPWQFMDETFRSRDQALSIVEQAPEPDEVEPRSHRGVHERYIRQAYRGERRGDDSLQLCQELRPAENGMLLMVLAQAGYGKTWLTRAYNYAAAKRYLEFPGHRITEKARLEPPPPIPFLIPFGDYRKLASIAAIVRVRLEALGVPEYTTAAFRHLLSKGRLVLVLDGFDELLESSPFHARENLKEIQQAIQGNGRMILTSRTTFFRNQGDVDRFMGTDRPPGLELVVVTLEPFDERRRNEFLRNRGATRAEVTRISRLAMGELSGGPQTLSFLLEIVREGAIPTDTATRAEVFSRYADRVFARERDRQGFSVSDAEQASYLKALAYETLSEDVTVLPRELVEIATPGDLSTDDHNKLLGHYLLQRAQDGLAFEHHLVRDFFAAESIRERIKASDAFSIFDLKLTYGAAGFLAELLPDEELTAHLAATRTSAQVYRNLLMIALEKVDRQPAGASASDEIAIRSAYFRRLIGQPSLAGTDIAGLQFSLLNFSGWSFKSCRARNARFVCCDLREATEIDSLSGASLENCLLREEVDESALARSNSRLRRFLTLFARPGDAFSFTTAEVYEHDLTHSKRTFWDQDTASALTALGFAHWERAKRKRKFVLDREADLRDFFFRRSAEGVGELLDRLQR